MNKKYFIDQLIKELKCDEEYAKKVLNIYEKDFIIGNKEKTVELFISNLNVSNETANSLYEVCRNIVESSLKNKVLHPFKKENCK